MLNKIATIVSLLFLAVVITAHFFIADWAVIPVYGVIVVTYVIQKVVFAELYRRQYRHAVKLPTDGKTCDVAIAYYNEKPDLLIRSIKSALAQSSVEVGRVVVVDDGSVSSEAHDKISAAFEGDDRVLPIRYEKNAGKRAALSKGIRACESEFVALLDSDTVLEPDALAKSLEIFGPGVSAVTGNVVALNRDANWLTKLIDARYRNAFLVERSSQSFFGSVLCASGVLSVYRTKMLQDALDEWAGQTFLGKPVQFGDDRRLTGIALRRGKVLISPAANAKTEVPTSPWHFIKQQIRWNKSFLRESGIFIKEFGVLSFPGAFSMFEMFFWLFYLSTILNAIYLNHDVGAWSLVFVWLAYVIASGLFRNISVIAREPRLILLAPLYSLVHVLVLTPLRLYSLATILDTRWGTR